MDIFIELNGTFENITDNFTSYEGLPTNVTDVNNTSLGKAPSPPLYIVISSTVLYSVIFLVGILGNLLVVLVITCSRRMKTAVNVYLVNLCVADLLVITICMPSALVDLFAKEIWYFGPVLCKLVPFLENTVANVSILTIVVISIERYKVIRHPLQSINEESTNVWQTNTIMWLVCLAFCIPWIYVVDFREYSTRDRGRIQVCRSPINEDWKRFYILLMSSCFFILPAVGLLVINCHIYCLLRRSCHQFITAGNKREYKRRQKQVANNVASIVVIFFLCHLPFRVSGLWFTFAPTREIRMLGLEKILLIIYSSRVLFYLNHAINPLVYNFVSSKFRESSRELWIKVRLCRMCRRDRFVDNRGSYRYTARTATTAHQMQSQL